jgi:hypothetical protein
MNVVGHNVAIVGERHLANSALSVLLNNFAVEQLPHLSFGAEFAVSPGVVRIFNTSHPMRLTLLSFWVGSRPQQESDL